MEQQKIHQEIVKKEKKEKRAVVDQNKVTKWAGDEESEGDEETPDLADAENKETFKNTKINTSQNNPSQSKNGIYCSACKKLFKSCSQWENHQISKKHKQTVYNLSPQEGDIYKQKLKEIEKIIKKQEKEKEEEAEKELQQIEKEEEMEEAERINKEEEEKQPQQKEDAGD